MEYQFAQKLGFYYYVPTLNSVPAHFLDEDAVNQQLDAVVIGVRDDVGAWASLAANPGTPRAVTPQLMAPTTTRAASLIHPAPFPDDFGLDDLLRGNADFTLDPTDAESDNQWKQGWRHHLGSYLADRLASQDRPAPDDSAMDQAIVTYNLRNRAKELFDELTHMVYGVERYCVAPSDTPSQAAAKRRARQRLFDFALAVASGARVHPAVEIRAAAEAREEAAAQQRIQAALAQIIPPGATKGSPLGPLVPALTPEERQHHVYLVGATGAGKTTTMLHLIQQDIEAQRVFCVLDLRGDLIDRVMLRLAEAPHGWHERLLLIDLRQETAIPGFNPLQGAGKVHTRVEFMISIIRRQFDSWGPQIEQLLSNTLYALAEAGWTLLEIEPFLSNPAFRAQVLAQVTDPLVHSFFANTYHQLSASQQLNWRLPILNRINRWFAVPQLCMMFGQRNTTPVTEFLNSKDGYAILVALGVDHLHGAASLAGGFLVNALQLAIMARADLPEAERVPLNMYVDEFQTMASDEFEAIIAQGRRFKHGLCLGHQNLSQLPGKLADAIRGNAGTKLFYRVGAQDASALARECIGYRYGAAEDIRMQLMQQATGEAFLLRSNQESLRVRLSPYHDPPVAPAQVTALKTAAQRWSRPRREIEAELVERVHYLAAFSPQTPRRPGLGAPPGTPPLPGTSVPPGAALSYPTGPTYEIRHDKLDHFKPAATDAAAEDDPYHA